MASEDIKEALNAAAIQIRDEKQTGANTANRVGSLLLAMIETFSDSDIEELAKIFLRKDQDDIAKGVITFENQIKSHDFAQGNLMGAGWSIYRDGNGNVVVETDRMIIRKDLSVSELIVNQETFQKGSTIYVKGGCTITRVEEADTYYRCYFDNKDGEEFSGFVVGDQARCQRYDKSYQNVIKYYWRLVVGVGDDYVDLSKTDSDGTGLPTEGDDIAQLGNRNDKTRQSAVVISPDSGGSVIIWAGIDSFSLSEKNMIDMGVDASTGEAYFYGYGNMYMGDRNQTSFMRFTKNNGVEICGSLAVGTKLGDGRDLKEAIDSATPEGYQEFVDAVTKSLGDLQNQVDGKIDNWFQAPDPSTSWTTNELKSDHVGDMWYHTTNKELKYYSSNYSWEKVEDKDTIAAYETASKAKDTADNKRRVFTTTPTTPYDKGDLWAGGSSQPLKRCINSRSSGSYNSNDWDDADNSNARITSLTNSYNTEVPALKVDLDKVKQQTDKEYTLWFGDYTPTATNKPASDWTTDALKAEHEEDLFYNTSAVSGEGGRGYRYLSGAWEEITDHDTLAALEQLTALQNRVSDFDYLKEAFKDDETLVSGGLVMSSLIGVRNALNEMEAFLNGSDFAKDETHGKLLLGGGIPSGAYPIEERAKTALTRLYEDGYLYTEYMKAKGAILDDIRVLSAVIEGDLILGDSHIMSIQSTDGIYPAIVWDTNLLKLGLEQINGNVSGLVQLGDLYGKNTSIRPNRIEVADTPVSADNLNRNKVVVESGIIYIYNKNYPTPMTIKVSDEGKLNISNDVGSLDLFFSDGKPIIYSSAWPSQNDVPSGGVFMDGDGYLKIKG